MSHQAIKVGQLEIRYLVEGIRNGGLGIFEMLVPPSAKVPPPHSHTQNEECVYVLDGTLCYSVDNENRDLKPGDWMSTPRGAVHHFCNTSTKPARVLVILSPDIGEQYFHDVGAIINAGGPPDKDKLLAVMSNYGLVAAAPKPSLSANV